MPDKVIMIVDFSPNQSATVLRVLFLQLKSQRKTLDVSLFSSLTAFGPDIDVSPISLLKRRWQNADGRRRRTDY